MPLCIVCTSKIKKRKPYFKCNQCENIYCDWCLRKIITTKSTFHKYTFELHINCEFCVFENKLLLDSKLEKMLDDLYITIHDDVAYIAGESEDEPSYDDSDSEDDSCRECSTPEPLGHCALSSVLENENSQLQLKLIADKLCELGKKINDEKDKEIKNYEEKDEEDEEDDDNDSEEDDSENDSEEGRKIMGKRFKTELVKAVLHLPLGRQRKIKVVKS